MISKCKSNNMVCAHQWFNPDKAHKIPHGDDIYWAIEQKKDGGKKMNGYCVFHFVDKFGDPRLITA